MEGKKNKSLLIGSAITLIAAFFAVILRTYGLVYLTDSSSGFYTNPSHWSVIVLDITVVFVCVLGIAVGIINKDKKLEINTEKNVFIGSASILFAISLLADFATQAVNIFELFVNFNGLLPLRVYLYQAGIIPMIFQGLSAFFAAFLFGLYGLKRFGKKIEFEKNFKIIALAPVIWLMCRMVVHFMVAINYLNVSQRAFEMFTIAFAMLFFFMFTRSLAGIGKQQSIGKFIAFGFPLVILAAVISLPRLLVAISGNSFLLVQSDATAVTDLMMGVFAVSKLFDKR